MAIDPKKVLVGAPDQSPTTGAVNYADTSATPPQNAKEALSGFTPCGYVSEDGLTLSTDYGTTKIKDWSKSTVRTLLDEFSGTVTFAFIQTDYESLCAIFGSDYVVKTAATASQGERITVKLGAHLAPARSYAFNMKDGDARVRVYLPNAQASLDGDLTFVAGDAITWNVKLECGVDQNGESIYIMTDDGVFAGSSGVQGA